MNRKIVPGALFISVCGTILLLSACNQTEPGNGFEPVQGTADSVSFWPPQLESARTNDTLILLVHNFNRVHTCAEPLENREAGWLFRSDSSGEYYRFRAAFYEKPKDEQCPPDPGVDSAYRVIFPTVAGRKLYLQNPAQELNDSVLFVGTSAELHTFEHVRAGANDTLSTQGRFIFRDSTAGHPRRVVYADSLGTCEILQAGSFERRGDTLAVRLRTLQADSMDTDILPACAGPYADTLEILPRLYSFP